MSYGSGPPKSPYGDELQDDSWSPTAQTGSSSPNYPQQPRYSEPYQRMNPMPNNFSQPAFNTPRGLASNPNQVAVPPIDQLSMSMSPEDLMFMRQIRSELLMTRVVPITAAAFSALYYYNRQKQLPQSIGRYVAIGFGSMFLSMLTYRDKFRSRVAESSLATPYMETVRRNLGLASKTDYFAPVNELNQISDYNSTDTWDAGSRSTTFGNQTSVAQSSNVDSQSFDSGFQKTDDAKPLLSYEELRAKNRGYAR